MSATNSIGDFDLNLVTLRKPLEFANGTIQSTAYTGAGGVPTLTEVLTAGSSASGQNISGVGTLTTSSLDVTSSSTFNGDIIQSNSESNNIVQQNITTDGNQNVLRTTDMFGTLRLKRPTSANGGDLILYDVTGSSTDFTQFYLGGSAFAFKNLAKGGKIGITLQDSNNVELDPLTLTQSSDQVRVGINTTTPGKTLDVKGNGNFRIDKSTVGNNPTLTVADNTSGNTIGFQPNADQNSINPIVNAGDQNIYSILPGTVGNTNLVLTTRSDTTSGVKIYPDETVMGAGGNADYPSDSIDINGSSKLTSLFGTNLNVNQTNVVFTSLQPIKFDGGIKFADNTIQTTASVPSTSVSLYNDTFVTYSLIQPSWSVTNLYPITVPAGVYQSTIFFRLLNGSSATVNFNYFSIVINGSITYLARDSSPNWTLIAGDDIYRNTSLVFVNTTTQPISVQLLSNITSGAFSGTAPTVQIFSYLLTKIASYP